MQPSQKAVAVGLSALGFHWSQSVSSVAQSCPTLCGPKDCSTPGLPVHLQLLELAQTHVHRVGDGIQASNHFTADSMPVPCILSFPPLSHPDLCPFTEFSSCWFQAPHSAPSVNGPYRSPQALLVWVPELESVPLFCLFLSDSVFKAGSHV